MRCRGATREIGIRVALGARPAQVVSLALGRRSCPSWRAWGSVVRWLSPSAQLAGSLLYGVGPSDPVTFVGAPLGSD